MRVKSGSHEHTFITPVSDRTGLWIDYVELYPYQGFSPGAINAIANVDRVKLNQWVSLVLADFSQSSKQRFCWSSLTPMFLSRHPVIRNGKARLIPGTCYQKDCAEHQALKYLQFLPHLKLEGESSFDNFPTGSGMKIDGELIAVCRCELWIGAGKTLNGKYSGLRGCLKRYGLWR